MKKHDLYNKMQFKDGMIDLKFDKYFDQFKPDTFEEGRRIEKENDNDDKIAIFERADAPKYVNE